MWRLKVVFNKHRGVPIFGLDDIVSLLTQQREEAFDWEYAICFFQFQTWILFPDDTDLTNSAGLIAATRVLDQLDEDLFVNDESARQEEEELRPAIDFNQRPTLRINRLRRLQKEHRSFHKIYNHFISESGGLLALVNSPTPAQFDQTISSRIARMNVISDLIDYRLRYVEHQLPLHKNDSARANHNHAMFFCWWPTHEIEGKRGKTHSDKSVTPRTMREWWKKLEMSAIFVYLIHKCGFDQLLPSQVSDEFFVSRLRRDSEAKAELLRFFGAYAYIVDLSSRARADLTYVKIPDSITRVAASTAPFSKQELAMIEQYDENYTAMND